MTKRYETGETTCPVIGAFIEVLDDRLPRSKRGALDAMVNKAEGSRSEMKWLGGAPSGDGAIDDTDAFRMAAFSEVPVNRAQALAKAAVNVFAASGLRACGMTEEADALAKATDFEGHDDDPGDTDATDAAYLIAYRAVYAANAMRGGHQASITARAAGDAARTIADAELHAAYADIDGERVRYFNDVDFAIKAARFAAHCACDAFQVADIETEIAKAVDQALAV